MGGSGLSIAMCYALNWIWRPQDVMDSIGLSVLLGFAIFVFVVIFAVGLGMACAGYFDQRAEAKK